MPAEHDPVAVMALVDGLTKWQRRLVHEYGLVLALHVLDECPQVPEARRVLEAIRRERQERLLRSE